MTYNPITIGCNFAKEKRFLMKKTIVLLSALLSTGLILSGCSFGLKSSSVKSDSATGSNQVVSSSSDTTNFDEKKVTGIAYDVATNKVSWNKLDGAVSYLISISAGKGGSVSDTTVTDTFFDFSSGNAEDFTVNVTAVNSSKTKSLPASRVFHFMASPTKASVKYNYGTYTWPAVSHATAYNVYLNDSATPKQVAIPSYTIPEGVQKGHITILPLCNDTESDGYYSVLSEEISFNILPTPSISFQKSTCTISWGSVTGASGYYMTITLDTVGVYDSGDGFGKEASSYQFAFHDAGQYIVSLAAKSDDPATQDSAYVTKKITRLADPSDIKCVEGDANLSISFDGDINATGYEVTQNGTSMGTVSNTTYPFPLTSTSDDEETINFSVRATSTDNDVLDSIGTADLSITKLATPKNIRIENGTILWDAVTKALEYYVSIDGNIYPCSSNSYKISTIGEGSHVLKVRAVGDHKLIIAGKWANAQNIVKLKAPTNLKVSDSHILSWDPVTSSTSYKVVTDNGAKVENAVGTSYNIPAITTSTTLTVKAVGDGGFIMDSDLSAPMSLYSLNAPAGLQVKNGAIAWNPVDHAASYTLMIGAKSVDVTGTTHSLDDIAAGSYAIKVKAVGAGVYFDSAYSTPLTVTILPTSGNISFSVADGITWSKVVEATGYRLFVDGTTYDFGPSVLSYKPHFVTSGTHTVKVRALGNDASNLLPSQWKETTTTATALAAPTNVAVARTTNGVTVTATIDPNASGFVVVYGGTEHVSTTNTVTIDTTTPGSVDVYCYCKGDGTVYVDSEHTTTQKVTVLAAPSNMAITKKDTDYYVATWDDVTNAEQYHIVVRKYTSDTAYTDTELTRDSARAEIDTSGIVVTKIMVTVTAISSDPMTLASDASSKTIFVS
jgi:hypothetical protein